MTKHKKHRIDLNADVGEGIGNYALLMPYLSSCNIACGGHAGDKATMQQVVKMAIAHNVKIGAHPSFPDKVNFGRVILEMNSNDLFESLLTQIQDLLEILNTENTTLHHIKPHGALYNLAAKDANIANVIIEVIQSFSQPLKLYAPYKSVIAKCAASKHIEVIFEGFADRNYNDDLSLVSRKNPEALITEKEAVFNHILNMILNQKITTINRIEAHLLVNTICVHSDTKNAAVILSYLNEKLHEHHIEIL